MNQTESLGQYRPLAQLGQGGMARVILCARSGPANIHKLLVVKEIREELANDAEFVAMFMDEARIATRMSHPNVVHTFDVGAEGNRYYMVMEYLEGQPMNAVLGRLKRKVPLAIHLRVLGRILAGLHYAHELNGFDGLPLSVVHRDVSPQNTILCYDGQVKLVDFGIAKAAGAASRTTAGMFKGKLGYVAPEQIAGGDIDRRADVFSVGVMLWEALVGRRLTYGENEAAILHKRTTGTQARVLEARPEADAELAAICDRAMELDPQKRFATAAEMLVALEARTEALGLRASDADIGQLASGAFVEERRGIQAIIERQLSLPARTAADASALMRLPLVPAQETGPQSIPPGGLPLSSGQFTPPTMAGTSVPIELPQFRSSKRRVAIFAGAAAVAVIGTIIAVTAITSSSGPKTNASASPIAPTSAAPSATTPQETTIEVAIEVTPARATITVDGKEVGHSPFHASVPKDPSNHQVQVSADGYQPETRTIGFDRDVRLELELKPRLAPVHVAPIAPSTDTAGTDLHVARPKHNIDEKDPY
ncbi:MAG TPA: serine/threonine-protein kinase [Polyangiaceae bacterium]|jgi:serine/threonine-protein kinase